MHGVCVPSRNSSLPMQALFLMSQSWKRVWMVAMFNQTENREMCIVENTQKEKKKSSDEHGPCLVRHTETQREVCSKRVTTAWREGRESRPTCLALTLVPFFKTEWRIRVQERESAYFLCLDLGQASHKEKNGTCWRILSLSCWQKSK